MISSGRICENSAKPSSSCLSFSAYFFLFRDLDIQSIATFKTMWGTLMTLFQMTLGEFKYDEFNYTRYQFITKCVFVLFMILVPILLLNMLIAMMGNTYQLVIQKSEKEWTSMWAKILISLEKTYGPEKLLKFREGYSIAFPTNELERGLVVISANKKNQAKRRRAAVANWKRSFRRILELMRKYHRAGFKSAFRFGAKVSQPTNPGSQLVAQRPGSAGRTGLKHMLQRMESSQFTRTLSRVALADDDDDEVVAGPSAVPGLAGGPAELHAADSSSGGSGSSGLTASTRLTFATSPPTSLDLSDGPGGLPRSDARRHTLSIQQGAARPLRSSSPGPGRPGRPAGRGRAPVPKHKSMEANSRPQPPPPRRKEEACDNSTGSLASLLSNMKG